MFNFSQLRSIAEGATGYVGGSYEDEMPGIPLEEAAAFLPVVCLESQNSLLDVTRQSNATMIEAAANAIVYGQNFDPAALHEATLESIKRTLKNAFEAIKRLIRSVIAKIRQKIDVMTKSGEQLWAKYGNSEALNKDFTGLTIEGYEFKGDKVLKTDHLDLEACILKVFNLSAIRLDNLEDNTVIEGIKEATTRIKNMSQGERDKMFASALSGKSLADDWRNDLVKEYWGTKKEIKFGEGFFTKSGIEGILKNAGADLRAIEQDYVALEKDVNDIEKSCNEMADKASKEMNKAKDKDESSVDSKAWSALSDYLTTYANLVHQGVSVLSAIKQIAIQFHNERAALAKKMLAKMLGYKKKKDSNESYGDDWDAMMFEFEL